jgi:hypothetical protein
MVRLHVFSNEESELILLFPETGRRPQLLYPWKYRPLRSAPQGGRRHSTAGGCDPTRFVRPLLLVFSLLTYLLDAEAGKQR